MAKLLNDASIATITSLDNTDYMNPVDASTGEISKITVANFKASLGVPLIYAGLISQSSTSAPTINETVNTTGQTWTPTRNDTGDYTLTCSSTILTLNKTLCFFNNSTNTSVGAVRTGSDTIGIATLTDNILASCSFKIEIYP